MQRSRFWTRASSRVLNAHRACKGLPIGSVRCAHFDRPRDDSVYAHAGCDVSDTTSGAVVHPLHLSTTFEREKESLELKNGYIYSRIGNPTRKSLEDTFAKLEFGTEGFAFSSGMQACTSLITAAPETHILIPDDLYHGVAVMAIEVFSLWGLTYEKIDMTDANLVQQKVQDFAMDSTHQKRLMLWMETPSNPQCKVTDIAGLCALVKSVLGEERVTTVVDATWSTPYLLNPLNLGADFVMHSTTKYVAGHSDVLSGVIVANSSPGAEAILPLLRICHQVGGGVCGPLEAYLTLRGLRTLPVRMRQHCKNAMTVAQFLEEHASIEQVFYPGLSSHPQHDLATEQMGGLYGGMLSFLVKPNTKDSDGEEEAFQVLRRVDIFKRATSLGGTESLIEHRASVEGSQRVSPPNLIRLSIGLEDPNDLIADLDQALSGTS